jgi:uncharacterized protein YeaO (DUF488 family)
VFEARSASDGYRILVEPEWPRGFPKGKAAGCEWMKSLGPSHNLRGWMQRNPRKVASFQDKYLAELGHNEKGVARACKLHKEFGDLTVLFAPTPPDAEQDWGVAETLARYLRAHCDA